MIVQMKKITVLAQSKDITYALEELGKQGVLHIEHQNAPVNQDVTNLEEKYNLLSRAKDLLSCTEGDRSIKGDPDHLALQVINLTDEKEVLLEDLKKINKDIDTWHEWGDFDPELIGLLQDKNIRVMLCKVTKKDVKAVPEEAILDILFKKDNLLYCAIISMKEIILPFHTLSLPEEGLQDMRSKKQKNLDRVKEIEVLLRGAAEHKITLSSHLNRIESLLEFHRAMAGAASFEKITYLLGYSPVDKIKSLEALAEKEQWGLLIEVPGDDDIVPTLIKNPRWIEIVKPLFQMIKTIPGYREKDVSMWFLLFFSVFFGMLIGDAGYGAVFLIINLLCHLKFRHKIKDKAIFFLMYVLSICAVIWGVLSGTVFGQMYVPANMVPLLPLLKDNSKVQGLCFFIGAFHLTIAHLWKFIRKMPSLKAFSEAGWICMLWTAYFLAKTLIIGEVFPMYGRWLLISGSGLIILFTNPTRNILKTIGSGIGGFLLNVINSFTDVVSYIRLFAVGAATVAVADAFNQMALGIGYNNIWTGIVTALILIFGHTLNILLGAMAVLVHGVRLNVLEFSSHLDMEFSGVEYRPFKTNME